MIEKIQHATASSPEGAKGLFIAIVSRAARRVDLMNAANFGARVLF